MLCKVRELGLEILLYLTPCTALLGTSKVSCAGRRLQNELVYVGEMQIKNLD